MGIEITGEGMVALMLVVTMLPHMVAKLNVYYQPDFKPWNIECVVVVPQQSNVSVLLTYTDAICF